VARFQGGPNAGHTLEIGTVKYVLHTIPSGVFNKNILNVIGNGVVIDPISFLEEIRGIGALGIDICWELIFANIWLFLPAHISYFLLIAC
jgi:adenylosuccinate synthase